MITKLTAFSILKKWKKVLIKQLNMEKEQINIHLYKSSSKFLKDKGIAVDGEMGLCYNSSIGADIILFYDRHKNKEEFLGTLIHELLHAKLSELSSMISLYSDTAEDVEEDFIRDMENFIMYMRKNSNRTVI